MNIEGAIKLLKQEPDFSLSYYKREKAIDILLEAYEKQQMEIKDLKKQIPQDKIFYYSEKDYISKDKIKEKIEEYNKKCNECNFQNTGVCKEFKAHYNCSIQSVLELLKELMGEINI